MFKNLNLSRKFISGFLVTAFFTLVVGILGISSAGTINGMLNSMYENNLVRIKDVTNAEMQAVYHNRDLYDYIIEADKAGMDRIAKVLDEHEAKMQELLEKYGKTQLTDPEKQALQQANTQWPAYLAAARKVMAFSYEGKNAEAMVVMQGEASTAFQAYDDTLSKIVDINDVLGRKAYDDSDTEYYSARRIMVGLIIVALILSIGLGVFLTRSITEPINRIVDNLNASAGQVAAASLQISSASHALAADTSQQAAALEETATALEEMATMTRQNADNAEQAHSLSRETNVVVKQYDESMQQLMASMSEISKASEATAKIIKTIDEIAFQTKLLALNAAVEAAQAGEVGAGFAVVADEVRNLAMRAAEAARNTATLIEGTVKKVEDGSKIVTRAKGVFTDVGDSAVKVSTLVGDISTASNEQAIGVEQINRAITELDGVVQKNAANSEESAAASEELSAQAAQMKEAVAELMALIHGGDGSGDEHSYAATPVRRKAASRRTALVPSSRTRRL
jgi:methyl-accepting chemotaxis protein